jgi:hypothetical protein
VKVACIVPAFRVRRQILSVLEGIGGEVSKIYKYSGGVSGPKGRFLTTRQTVAQIGGRRMLRGYSTCPPEQPLRRSIPLPFRRERLSAMGAWRVVGDRATQVFICDSGVLRSVI